MVSQNPWNELSGTFDTHKGDPSDIHPDAADNILLAWPALLDAIRIVQPNPEGLNVLDFGCGTGGFCVKLLEANYNAVGCDGAEDMVATARKNVGNIPFYNADQNNLNIINEKPFDLVSAVMVFQFIENIAETFTNIGRILKPGGVLAFAVFNPDYVRSNRGEGRSFQGFFEAGSLSTGHFCPQPDLRIPTFIRDEPEYDRALEPAGFQRVASSKPPFTEEFLKKYPLRGTDTSHSEYLVMAYQKRPGF